MSSMALSWPGIVALVAALISAFALGFAFKSDRRKTGTDIRCTFSLTRSVVSHEAWVTNLSLRNGKDRSVAIYQIYLEIGHGFFVEVEDLASSPVVLEPYGAWYREYEPVDAYVGNLCRWTEIFESWPRRQRILLITSEGRHIAKFPKPTLYPALYGHLKNHATVEVKPQRLKINDQYYGSKARYLCAIINGAGQRREFPMYGDPFINQVENQWIVNDEILSSVENVKAFLQGELLAGRLPGVMVEVLDLAPNVEAMNQSYMDSAPYTPLGWFEYRVVNRLITMFSRRKRYKVLHFLITMVWNWIIRKRAKNGPSSTRPGPQEIMIRADDSDTGIPITAIQLERGQGSD